MHKILITCSLYFRFQVISHMNIFFTCKNTLVISLQLYRLLILCLERRPQHRRQSRIFSLIPSEAFEDVLADRNDFKESLEPENPPPYQNDVPKIIHEEVKDENEIHRNSNARQSRKNGSSQKKSSLKSRYRIPSNNVHPLIQSTP